MITKLARFWSRKSAARQEWTRIVWRKIKTRTFQSGTWFYRVGTFANINPFLMFGIIFFCRLCGVGSLSQESTIKILHYTSSLLFLQQIKIVVFGGSVHRTASNVPLKSPKLWLLCRCGHAFWKHCSELLTKSYTSQLKMWNHFMKGSSHKVIPSQKQQTSPTHYQHFGRL